MAIVWGAWVSSRFRVGLELTQSPATVTSSTTTVTITAKLYWQTYYYGWDSGINWAISGAAAASGTTAFDHGGDMQYTLMGQTTKVVTPSTSGPITTTFNGSGTGWAAYGGTATVSASITTAQKPFAVPAAPSAASVARVSDTQHTVSWTRNATAAAPYQDQYIERWDNVTNAYAQVGTISTDYTTSGTSSFTDTTTVANREYRYRVRARNSAGYTGYAYTGFIKTTPAAPGTPTAAKDASNNIVVTWSDNSAIAEQVEVWHAANGVWDGAALATLTSPATSYTHTAPSGEVTHKYRLRSKIATPALTSAYTADSNTVQLQAPPNAPTGLSPDGVPRDGSQAIVLTWQHNPVDTTPQSAYEVQYRVNGGSWVLSGQITSTTSSRTITAGTWTNGTTVEWQVRTWGAHATASAWSAIATISVTSPPTVVINSPAAGSVVNNASLTVSWGYFDAESSPQSQWEAKLYNASGQLLETKTGTSTDTSTTMATPVANGGSYSIGVRVRDSTGSWSAEDINAFTVTYAPPPTPTPTVSWQEETATVDVIGTVPAPTGSEVAVVSLNFYRSLDGGETWTMIATGIEPQSTIVDYIPPLNSTVHYMVEAVSATPSVAQSAAIGIYTNNTRYNRSWLNVGPGFAKGVFLGPNTTMDVISSRAKTLHQFAGRELPVEFSSINLERAINVKGVLIRNTTDPAIVTPQWDEIEDAVINYAAPACLRDLRGHRWFVSVDTASWAGPTKKIQDVGFKAVQVDWDEEIS